MTKMKIAYISFTFLADSDLPLLHELSKEATVDYFLPITNTLRQGTFFDVTLKNKGDIYPATAYPEMKRIESWMDLNHVFIVNKPVNHDWSWTSFKVSWQWMRMLKRNDYDIIHLTWPLRYNSFPLFFLHKRMVITMHDPVPHSSHNTLETRFHRWCNMRFIPYFILLNTTQRATFIEKYHLESSKVFQSKIGVYTYLKNIVPTTPFSRKPYILYIGSIFPHKGIEYFCEAMEPIIKENSNINAIIAGKGDFYFDISRYKKNLQYIFINRFITNEELVSLLSNCIAVVCPYIDATQSGIIVSAFGLSKPVIATTVGALPEMVKDKKYGFLVPPKDSKALKEAIQQMIQPGVALQMSKNIERQFFTGDESWSEIAKKMLDNYKTMILNRKK